MNVEQMRSPGSGRPVANQIIIRDDDATYFQSYGSVIVKITGEKVYLDKDYWDYSTTTGKYRNAFLREKKVDTERKLAQGIYKLANLNS